MAGSGFQPLSRGEVAEQLNALGYKNFSPEKIKQITEGQFQHHIHIVYDVAFCMLRTNVCIIIYNLNF